MHFVSAFVPQQSSQEMFVIVRGDPLAARESARSQLAGEVDLVAVTAFSEPGAADEDLKARSAALYHRALHSDVFNGSRADLDAAWSRISDEFARLPSRYDDETSRAAADAALEEPFRAGLYPVLVQRDGRVRRPHWGQCRHEGMVTTLANADPLMAFDPEEPGATLVAQFAAVDPAWARWACRAFERAISAGDAPPFAKAA